MERIEPEENGQIERVKCKNEADFGSVRDNFISQTVFFYSVSSFISFFTHAVQSHFEHAIREATGNWYPTKLFYP